jgi:hypothetical protein
VVNIDTDEEEAIEFLAKYNLEYGKLVNEYSIASWGYETNITDENEAVLQHASIKVNKTENPSSPYPRALY